MDRKAVILLDVHSFEGRKWNTIKFDAFEIKETDPKNCTDDLSFVFDVHDARFGLVLLWGGRV